MKVIPTLLIVCTTCASSAVFGSDPIRDAPFCSDIEKRIQYDPMSLAEGDEIRSKNARAMEHLGETIGRFCANKHGSNSDRLKHCMASRSLDYAKLFATLAEMYESGEMPLNQ